MGEGVVVLLSHSLAVSFVPFAPSFGNELLLGRLIEFRCLTELQEAVK